ncbi:MAG: hypothetical protein EWM73_03270 [Nitrospira sp.]|nr:MAG: hypothetical protein EWM73_03270 [Nitrospira sp.]
MLLLKIAAPLLLLLAVVAQYLVDHVWHDKRTKWHRWTRAFLLVLQLAAGVGTGVVVVREHYASEENAAEVKYIREEAVKNADASAARDYKSQAELSGLQSQVRDLSGRLEPFVRIALKKYPGLPEGSALERLTVDLADLRTRTTRLERKVHTVAVTVELVLEGEWAEGLSQGRESAVDMPNDPYVRFVHSGANRGRDILCYPTAISRQRDAQGRVIVNFEASVRPGGWPLGQTVDDLKGYQNAQIGVAMVERRNAKSANVILKEARLKVFINGVPEVSRDDLLDTVINLPEKGIRVLNLEGVDFLAPVSKKS